MSVEATSALSFNDLILEVARKMGTAYYGETGDEEAQIPIDEHDLTEAKRHVNDAIRMFISDAPPAGWRWTKPVASIALWPSVAVDVAKTILSGTYVPADDHTPITANTAIFYPSMEEKEIVITGVGTFTIKQYVSSTVVNLYGNHTFVGTKTYSIAADGDYTLPRTFAGSIGGIVSFQSQTNRAVPVDWTHETTIRQLRENISITTGIPRLIAADVFVPVSGRRRYKLMTYPIPDQLFVVQFPFDLHFDELLSGTDVPPTPIMHDESMRAACRAIVEKDVLEQSGVDTAYYAKCLGNSIKADERSGPSKLGYFGNGWQGVNIRNFRDLMPRPNVTFNP